MYRFSTNKALHSASNQFIFITKTIDFCIGPYFIGDTLLNNSTQHNNQFGGYKIAKASYAVEKSGNLEIS